MELKTWHLKQHVEGIMEVTDRRMEFTQLASCCAIYCLCFAVWSGMVAHRASNDNAVGLKHSSFAHQQLHNMAEFHPLPTGSSQESARWLEWNKQAVERAQRFADEGKNDQLDIQQFLQHLTYKDYEHIYEPAEDTYLLLDALQYEANSFPKLPLCLEVGCGTGIVSAMLTKLLSRNSMVVATDVNPQAVASAKILGVESILCDLASCIHNPVDILIFNPPYVPTPDEEIQGNGVEVSWAGGTDGRRVIDRWVDETLLKILARPHGVSYLITVDDNRPEQLSGTLFRRGMTMRPLFRRRAKNEYLTVQKITWAI